MSLDLSSSQIYAERWNVPCIIKIVIVFFCEIMFMTGCGNDMQENDITDKEKKLETEQVEQDTGKDYQMTEDNLTGYGTSENYEMLRASEEETAVEPTYEEMLAKFNQKFFNNLSIEDIETRINDRSLYYKTSGYYYEILYRERFLRFAGNCNTFSEERNLCKAWI